MGPMVSPVAGGQFLRLQIENYMGFITYTIIEMGNWGLFHPEISGVMVPYF